MLFLHPTKSRNTTFHHSTFYCHVKHMHRVVHPLRDVGLVIEIKRETEELDGFMWFCENCHEKLYEEHMYVSDIVAQLPPIMNRFYSDVEKRTCKKCGMVMEPPAPVK